MTDMERGSMLRVLTYHRVADPAATPHLNPALVSATPAAFEASMKTLARHYRVVSIEEVLECVRRARPLPARAVLLTFDDGYRDFAEIAWPILRWLRLPVTLFVPTAYPGDPTLEFWWDRLYRAFAHCRVDRVEGGALGPLPLRTPAERRTSLKRLLTHVKSISHDTAMSVVDGICATLECPAARERSVLTWEELRRLVREGVNVGSHTRTHPILTMIPSRRLREEIRGARQDLDREIGGMLPVLAYPAGAHDSVVLRAVGEEGIELAFTTIGGHNAFPPADPLRLCRTNLTRRTSPAALRLRLTRWGGAVDRWRQAAPRPPDRTDNRQSVPWGKAAGGSDGRAKVAYIMSRFPTVTETFVLNEVLAMEELGLDVHLYPLLRQRQQVRHPGVNRLMQRAHFHPFVSLPVLRANWHFLRRAPATYVTTWREILRGTWGSWNFFLGGIAILPKAVRFAYEMDRSGIRHVHAHFANHPTVAALVIHRLTGIPFSFTAHGSDLHVDRRMLDRKVAAARFAVTVADFNRDLIIAECGAAVGDKIHVIHCGVDPTVFSQPQPRQRRGGLEIVCVARFEEVKGHRFLIHACALLRERGLTFVCHLVGDGPLRHEIERQIMALGLTKQIVLHGACAHPEVARKLGASDVVVLASAPTRRGKREGIPVALMEAMAMGIPVIAGATGGIPELVEPGRTGFLVTPGDVSGLADALETLANDPSLGERLGKAARQKVLRQFNLRESAHQLASLFLGTPVWTHDERTA